MTMRTILLASALAASVLVHVPALARDRAQQNLAEAAEKLSDPALQGSLATALASLSKAMMSIRMAPFTKAMESVGGDYAGEDRAERIDPDATLGDMMGPEAADMPQALSEKVPQLMNGMAGMAGAFGEMLPQFEAIGKELRRSLPRR